MRMVTYKYLKKKPMGLQSVLDLLIMDMIKVNGLNSTSWICFVMFGYFHGQLPYIFSLIWIWILINVNVYLFCLYQYFLLIKTIVVFRGTWLEDISDYKILTMSRIFAIVYSSIRLLGDYLLNSEPSKSVMATYLTGKDTETYVFSKLDGLFFLRFNYL